MKSKKAQHIQHAYNISTFKHLELNYWGIRKCANTTIKYVLLRAEKPDKVKTLENNKRFNLLNAHGKPHRNWVHENCNYITPEKASQNGFKNFTVLRDPVERVYSMYNNILERPERAYASGSNQFKKDIKLFVKKPNMSSFLDILEQYPDKDRNIHYRSQKSHCLIENIVKVHMSRLSTTIQQIHPSLVVDVTLNASGKHLKPDTHTLERIHQVYKEDFELLKECIS